MKKLLGFIFFVVLIIGLSLSENKSLFELFPNFISCTICTNDCSIVGLHSSNLSDNNNETEKSNLSNQYDVIKNGSYYILTFDNTDKDIILNNLNSFCGLSLKVVDTNYKKVINKLQLRNVKYEYLSDGVVVTGNTNKLNKVFNYTDINIQIFDNGQYVLIGYPLIMQGF